MNVVRRPDPKPAELESDSLMFARAMELAYGPSRRQSMGERTLSVLYWAIMLAGLGWLFSMAIDRDVPVKQVSREIVNENKQVVVGTRLLIKGSRVRSKQCELTRRWWVIDGGGRRLDFEPQHFDAYGEVGDEVEITGPHIPLDAMPGRGRLYGVLAYDCNPLQRALGWSIVVMLPPVEFEILPRPPVTER